MVIELKTGGLLYLPTEILAQVSLRAGDQLNCEVVQGKVILTPASFYCFGCFPPTS